MRRALPLHALLVAAAAMAGCLGAAPDDGPDAATPAGPVHVKLLVAASGTYPSSSHFTLDRASVPAGAIVDLVFKNQDANPLGTHDWSLLGVSGATTRRVDAGLEDRLTFTAPAPGDYPYECTVPMHKDHGLSGTLRVVAPAP